MITVTCTGTKRLQGIKRSPEEKQPQEDSALSQSKEMLAREKAEGRRAMFYIGVDLGTSAVKLLLMDEKGCVRKVVSKEYPLYFPRPGWSEQRPEDWFLQTMEGLKELVADCDRSQVEGISFGGQMHGLVILDEKDEVIRPAILWNDGRTGEETDYLNQVIGKERLSEYTGNIAFAGFTAPSFCG